MLSAADQEALIPGKRPRWQDSVVDGHLSVKHNKDIIFNLVKFFHENNKFLNEGIEMLVFNYAFLQRHQ
jgi:hypothetical protein